MTTPREPDGSAEPDGPATWGRAPAGGWGAAYDPPARGPAEYDRAEYDRAEYDRADDGAGYDRTGHAPGPYGDEPQYGWQPPAYAPEPDYRASGRPGGRSRQEPAWGQRFAPVSRRAARRRGRLRLAIASAVVLLVAVVLVLGFVTPGWFVTRVFDPAAVQTGVAQILTDDYAAGGVADIRCPEGVEVTTGATFRCDATIDGDPVTVPIRVTDAKGGYEVGRPT
jgi:hypothetical protein